MLRRGVSSFNAFIHEHESDEEFGSDADDGSSVYDDAGPSPNSPSFSQASPNAQTNSSKRGRRKQNSILKRTLRKLLFPLRILYVNPPHKSIIMVSIELHIVQGVIFLSSRMYTR